VTNPSEITLSFNLALDPATIDEFAFTVQTRPGAVALNMFTAVITNGTNVILTTDARAEGIDYDVVFNNTGPASLCPGTHVLGTYPLFQAQPLVSYGQAWRYLDTDVDPGASWNTVGFDDSSWKQGPGPFDAKKAAAGSAGLNCRDDIVFYGLGAVGTCLSLSNAPGFETSNCFFRTHFRYSGNPATNLFLFHGKFDDDAVVYLNGTELERVGIPSTATLVRTGYGETNYVGARGVGDGDAQDSALFLAPAGLINGDNVIAVEIYQANAGSSDLTMALEIDEVLPTVHPKLVLTFDGFEYSIAWGAGTLESATSPTGPWSTVSPQTNPYTVSTATGKKFYRVKR
jgi:hypothetical protein